MANPDALKAAFDAATSWDEWFTALVVGGLIVEFAALLFFSKDMPRKEKMLLAAGSIMVAVGVGGEYVFGGRAASAAKALQQRSDEKIATLSGAQETDHKIAAQAAAYAARLGISVGTLRDFVGTQIKQNKAAIDELKRGTSDLQKARADALSAAQSAKTDLAMMVASLKAEENALAKARAAIAPRDLSPTQQEAITKDLDRFAHLPVLKAGTFPGDPI